MNKTITKGGYVIDLTDDAPDIATTTEPEIEFIGLSKTSNRPSISRRRESSDSDIVIVEDETREDGTDCSVPVVACHFFFPGEDVEEEQDDSGVQDPLEPAPEWVDCSILQSEEAPVHDGPPLENNIERNPTFFGHDDPLDPNRPIKTEPETELDIKPTLFQISQEPPLEINVESSLLCKRLTQETNPKLTKEILKTNVNRPSISNRRKSCPGKSSIPSEKSITYRRNIGTESDTLSRPNVSKKRKNSVDINQDGMIPSKKLNTNRKIGPKCSKFRQEEVKLSSSPSDNQSGRQSINVNSSLDSKKTNPSKKIGPKSSKFKQEEVKLDSSPSDNQRSCQSINVKPLVDSKKTITSKKIGPKCAKFRQEEVKLSSSPSDNQSSCQSINGRLSMDSKKTNTSKKIGPKCSKFTLEEMKLDSSSDNQSSCQSINIKPLVDSKKTITSKKIGPKCAKFRQEEVKLGSSPSDNQSSCQSINVKPLVDSKKTITSKKIGPKCAKFRQGQEKLNSSNDKQKNYKCSNEDNSVSPRKTSTLKRVGPRCAKFRMNQTKEHDTSGLFSKDLSSLGKIPSQNEEIKDFVIKPALVSIGPKLPLPQCFQQNQTSQEPIMYDLKALNNDMEKDHIVLKIYTCPRCDHKCTDPLFHEAHMDLCNSKRRSQPFNLSLQDYNKQNGFYKCEICTFKFKNQENLSTHLNQHGVKGFICHICYLTFLTLSQLNQHGINDHKNLEKVFSCNICEYASQNIDLVKEHMIQHNLDKNLFCSLCRQNYEDIYNVEKHYKECHKNTKNINRKDEMRQNDKTNIVNFVDPGVEKKLSIASVDKKEPEINDTVGKINENVQSQLAKPAKSIMCEDTDNLASAIKMFETEISERNGNYHCNGCFYKFAHKKNLKKHKQHHLKNKPFSCCNGSFVSFSHVVYSKHVYEKHKSSKLVCSMCPMKFGHSRSLGDHMVMHINDGLFCYQCRKNLENIKSYRKHISSVHGGKLGTRYSCNECSFKTSSQSGFTRHQLTHKKSKTDPETASLVKSNVGEANVPEGVISVKKISSVTHEPTPDPSVEIYNCPVCSLKLSSADALIEHHKSKHEQVQSSSKLECDTRLGIEAFKCNKCVFKCCQPTTFFKHMRKGHAKQKFICNICRNEFTFLKLYMNHMKNHAACAVVYACNECRFTSRKTQVFGKHMRTHVLKCCPLCDYKTLRFDSFKGHLLSIHTVGDEPPSPSNISVQNFTNNSFNAANEIVSETSDSTWKNDTVKHHECCFCTYETDQIDDLRKHMAIHFTKDSESPNKDKFSGKAPKQSSTVKRWKNKTLPTRKNQIAALRASGLSNLDNNGVLYMCTQCEYKRKDRKSVACHLKKVHNTIGSVRNCTIKKIFVKESRKEHTEENTVNEDVKKVVKILKEDHSSSHVANQKNDLDDPGTIVDAILSEKKTTKEKNSTRVTQNNSTADLVWKCSYCNLQKLSLIAQLQHKKYGHIAFWCRPFPCKMCGLRFANQNNLSVHIKWKHTEVKREHQEILKKKINGVNTANKINQQSDNFSAPKKEKLIVKKRNGRTDLVKCPGCNFERLPQAARDQHSKLGHDVFWDRPIPCNICQMRFPNKGALGSHMSVHETLTCTKCNRFVTFKLKYLLQHKETCLGSGEKCVESRPVGTTNNSLIQDKENESSDKKLEDEENYMCGECDFVTKNVIQFSTHMFIHSGIPDD